jgi:5S rRNA maturation endonuclease (ribonuclease M5)
VAYAVGNIDESRMNTKQQTISQLPIDIFFNIGDVSIAASRETLSNDERTLKNVLCAFEQVYDEMLQQVNTKLHGITTPWQARLAIWELTNTPGIGSIIRSVWDNGGLFGHYTHFSLDGKYPTVNETDYDYTALTVYSRSYQSRVKRGWVFTKNEDTRKNFKKQVQKGVLTKKEFNRIIDSLGTKTLFILNDWKRNGDDYAKHIVEGKLDGVERAFVFSAINSEIFKNHFSQVEKETENMVKKLGKPPLVRVSTLAHIYPELERARRNRIRTLQASPPVKRVLVAKSVLSVGRNRKAFQDMWESLNLNEEKLNSGVRYYIPLDFSAPVGYKFDSGHEVVSFINAVKESKLFGIGKNEPIYGIKAKRFDRVTKKLPGQWVDFIGYVLAKMKDVITADVQHQLSLHYIPLQQTEQTYFLQYVAKQKSLVKGSPMRKFAEDWAAATTHSYKTVPLIVTIAEKLIGFKLKHLHNFNKEWDVILNLYPMIKISRNGLLASNIHAMMQDYCRLVDAESKF